MSSSTPSVSPLRQRMIDDMRMRKYDGKTQIHYIRAVRRLTAFLKRSPDTATAEDLRAFQLHMVETGTSPPTINSTLSGLKFFFDVTLGHAELLVKAHPVHQPRPLPVAIEYVTHQGLRNPKHYGPNAPTSIKALLKMLDEHRKRGFSIIQDTYAPSMSSMAAQVRKGDEHTTGVLVIAGPTMRLSMKRMQQFGPTLVRAAEELALSSDASPLLKSANIDTWDNVSEKTTRNRPGTRL